jgi:hypothetical protein
MIPTLPEIPTLFGASAVAAPASPAAIDLMTLYPGPIAATHKLRCTDGRFYTYYGDMEGFWWRSIDPGCFDVHLWTSDMQYYFGWQTPHDGIHWVVPPTLALPRYWDPSKPYRRESYEFNVNVRSPHNVRLETVLTLITIDSVTERGEQLYRLYGLTGTESETWYLSPALPVEGGGTAPGMRGVVFMKDGQTTAVWEFDAWVAK